MCNVSLRLLTGVDSKVWQNIKLFRRELVIQISWGFVTWNNLLAWTSMEQHFQILSLKYLGLTSILAANLWCQHLQYFVLPYWFAWLQCLSLWFVNTTMWFHSGVEFHTRRPSCLNVSSQNASMKSLPLLCSKSSDHIWEMVMNSLTMICKISTSLHGLTVKVPLNHNLLRLLVILKNRKMMLDVNWKNLSDIVLGKNCEHRKPIMNLNLV